MKTDNMTFSEALEAMKQGYKVRRKEWDNNAVAKDDYLCIIGNMLMNSDRQFFSVLKSEIILATDWEIYTEPKPEPQFEIGELVMMRNNDNETWMPEYFARKTDTELPYQTIGQIYYRQCAKLDKDIVFTNKPVK